MKNSYNVIENLLIIYSVDEGKLKVLLKKRKKQPYKGYWILPGEFVGTEVTLEESAENIFKKVTDLSSSNMFQGNMFSDLDRYSDERVIAMTYISITDKQLIDIKDHMDNIEWFGVDELPKLGFDHDKIIKTVTDELKQKILDNHNNILLYLFPSDFTLPEFQSFYEHVLGKNVDRRNFRKKIINQGLLIDTGEKLTNHSGRPGTLYRFNKENMKGKRI